MKVRAWREEGERRAVPTPDGPLLASKGDVVIVVIAPSWEKAAKIVAQLDRKDD